MTERIYFDDEDEAMDGFGWNVISDDGAVASRFATQEQAKAHVREIST